MSPPEPIDGDAKFLKDFRGAISDTSNSQEAQLSAELFFSSMAQKRTTSSAEEEAVQDGRRIYIRFVLMYMNLPIWLRAMCVMRTCMLCVLCVGAVRLL